MEQLDGTRCWMLSRPASHLGANCELTAACACVSSQGEVAKAVTTAIDAGYRHIDCACVTCYCAVAARSQRHSPIVSDPHRAVYGNEAEIGEALATRIGDGEGKIPRSDIFITSKLWNTEHKAVSARLGLGARCMALTCTSAPA